MTNARQLTAGGILLGVGLAGLFDGIVLHQILQWHHLLSSTRGHSTKTVAGLEANTLADGLFHLAAALATIAGIVTVLAAVRSGSIRFTYRRLGGHVLVGAGLFNLVEGLVDHQLLGLHHVRETAPRSQWPLYDYGFLVLLGLVPLVIGLLVARSRDS